MMNSIVLPNKLPDETEVVDDEHSISPPHYDITSYGADIEVETLISRLERGDIIIPEFQRSFVWNLSDASRFVESLLLGLPVPGVFFAVDEKSKQVVIDGQQRLKTIQFFRNGYFNPKENDNKQTAFKLKNVQERFKDKTYKTLDEDDRTRFNHSIIHATVVRQSHPQDGNTSVYHVFERLNSGGRRLYPQEIRRAIDYGSLYTAIIELNDNQYWRSIFGKKHSRLKDEELILRFFAFYTSRDDYVGPLNEFLNLFAKRWQNANEEILSVWKTKFRENIEIIYHSIGDKAFRPQGSFNAAVYDSVMVGVAIRTASDKPVDNSALLNAYNSLLKDRTYIDSVSSATSDEVNVVRRMSLSINTFSVV